MPFKETKEGQTHFHNDGCGEPAHNDMTPDKRVEEIVEEFEQVFWDRIGTETDPHGTQNMYLIRNEDDEVETGIDFKPEMEAIQTWLRTTLTQHHQDLMSEVVKEMKKYQSHCIELQEKAIKNGNTNTEEVWGNRWVGMKEAIDILEAQTILANTQR